MSTADTFHLCLWLFGVVAALVLAGRAEVAALREGREGAGLTREMEGAGDE